MTLKIRPATKAMLDIISADILIEENRSASADDVITSLVEAARPDVYDRVMQKIRDKNQQENEQENEQENDIT